MPKKTHRVDDILEDTYPIGFPVLEKDIAVFLNGLKLRLNEDFTFLQSINSVKIKSNLQVNDLIQIRLEREK